jgi:hypothetical protein
MSVLKSGRWEGEIRDAYMFSIQVSMDLWVRGNSITGNITIGEFDSNVKASSKIVGSLSGDRITLSSDPPGPITFTGFWTDTPYNLQRKTQAIVGSTPPGFAPKISGGGIWQLWFRN